jgi:hypothetical protein
VHIFCVGEASASIIYYFTYLYLIIKYVRFPSSTNFFGPFCPPTKPHITTQATGKLKNLSFKVARDINLKFPVPVQNSRTSFNLASSL